MGEIIQSLQRSGELVLYHDYRSRSFQDWSGYGNHGVPEEMAWAGDGYLDFMRNDAKIVVPDSTELRLTEGTLVAFGQLRELAQMGNSRFFNKEDAGGINYDWYHGAATQTFYMRDSGGAIKNLAYPIAGHGFTAITFEDGETPKGYLDGIYIGDYSGAVSISVDDADLVIGDYYSGLSVFSCESLLRGAIIVNRVLTATEVAQLYGEVSR